MKKSIYLLLGVFMALFIASKADAQYSITSHNIVDSCVGEMFFVDVNAANAGLTMTTYYGDGTSDVSGISGTSFFFNHSYSSVGSFTIKHVLYLSGTAIDSVTYTNAVQGCANMFVNFYYDANSNCTWDSGEPSLDRSMDVEIDSSGVPVDTVYGTFGFQYRAYGSIGTVYTFKVLTTTPTGLQLTCPGSASISVTLSSYTATNLTAYFGFGCNSSSSFDLGVTAYDQRGLGSGHSTIWVYNNYCTAESGTLTMTIGSKYSYNYAYPTPASVSGNTITWNFTNVAAYQSFLAVVYLSPVGTLTAGDADSSYFAVSPTSGDINTANNTLMLIDTINASFDPNGKSVLPAGNISAGTKLTYTLEFQNTGNAPAKNIHIMDTLSNYLDMSSLKVLNSTADMNVYSGTTTSGQNVIEFDFPAINLPDSTHHQQSIGMLTFSINSKTGLAAGTVIPNAAGIYFDDNAVVMTNTAYSKIGTPSGVSILSNNTEEIYPNPANDILNIKTSSSYTNATLVNCVGQVVINQQMHGTETRLNVALVPAGVYYLLLKSEDGTKVKKVVLNH